MRADFFRKSGAGAAAVLMLLVGASAFGVEQTPIMRLNAAGGQFFLTDFQGTDTSFAASGDWLFADGMKFSDDDTVVPTLSGQYLRRAQVNQIAGGGTLVSETLDNAATARWVHSIGSWDLKPNVSYKNELVTISNQESLGSGLFDLHQEGGGIEAEWKGETVKSVRQDFSITNNDYYHYRPSDSPLFGQELLEGNQALNFTSYDYELAGDFALWDTGLLTLSGEGSYLDYANQHVLEPGSVANSYTAESATRSDWMGTWVASVSQKLPPIQGRISVEGTATFTVDYVLLDSNQNDVDSVFINQGVVQFNPDYYSYGEYSLGPVLSLTLNGNLRVGLTYNFAHKDYRDRPTQDSSGNYNGGPVWTDTQTLTYSFSYPFGKGFVAQLSGGYVSARSNMHYENFYLYNYHYPYYFAGFGWAL